MSYLIHENLDNVVDVGRREVHVGVCLDRGLLFGPRAKCLAGISCYQPAPTSPPELKPKDPDFVSSFSSNHFSLRLLYYPYSPKKCLTDTSFVVEGLLSIAFESSFCYVIPFKNQARAVPKNAEITSPSLSTQNVICYD